jgi:hypothetical protein
MSNRNYIFPMTCTSVLIWSLLMFQVGASISNVVICSQNHSEGEDAVDIWELIMTFFLARWDSCSALATLGLLPAMWCLCLFLSGIYHAYYACLVHVIWFCNMFIWDLEDPWTLCTEYLVKFCRISRSEKPCICILPGWKQILGSTRFRTPEVWSETV